MVYLKQISGIYSGKIDQIALKAFQTFWVKFQTFAPSTGECNTSIC